MTAFRAVGSLVVPPRPARSERESEDLSTFRDRAVGASAVASDALAVAPPPEFWTPLAGPAPGWQVEGTLPEDPEARFVLRLPQRWTGGLAVAAAPGLLDERSLDLYWSDLCLSRGLAFACTDKGTRLHVSGGRCFIPLAPENRMARWYPRFTALARLARGEAERRYGRAPEHTYALGLSNGGALVHRALEEDPGLFDGGVEVSGVLWSDGAPGKAEGRAAPGLLEELPAALAGGGDRSALAAEYAFYWELVLAWLLGDLDPEYAGPPQDYRLEERPPAVRERIKEIAVSGRLQRPLISIAGGADLLVPAASHAEGYRRLVESHGLGGLHRLRVIERGSHVDRDRERHPWVEPLLPHAHAAFEELRARVERGATVPA